MESNTQHHPEEFCPYREWLDVPGGTPTNHYALLGVALFESDEELIAEQADALTTRLRQVRPGPRLAEWQKVLDRLSAAKRCLLDRAAREAYDAELRSATEPNAVRRHDPSNTETDSEDSAGSLGPMLFRMAIIFVAVAATVVGFGYYQHHRRVAATGQSSSIAPAHSVSSPVESPGSPQPEAIEKPVPPSPSPTSTEAAKPPVVPISNNTAPAPVETTKPVVATPKPAEPPKSPAQKAEPSRPAEPSPSADPAKRDALRRELSAARETMARRNLGAAQSHVEAARKLTQSAEEESEVKRVEALLENLKEFWKGISKILSQLGPAEELSDGKTQYLVVSVTPAELVLRTEGRNRAFPIKSLPRPVVEMLARSGFDPHPSSKILLGSFLAVDAGGDRREAKRLWEEARREGDDVGDLMRELEEPRPEAPAGKPSGR